MSRDRRCPAADRRRRRRGRPRAADRRRAARRSSRSPTRSCCPTASAIYPPTLHGEPRRPARLRAAGHGRPAPARRFLRLVGPPGAGKSQIARAIAYRLWTDRGRAVEDRHGAPFYGFVEMQPAARPRTSSSSATSASPSPTPAAQVAARRLGVRAGDARGLGGDDRRGQHRSATSRCSRSTPPSTAAWRCYLPADRRDRDRAARASPSCSPTTRGWSARPTSPTPGTRASPPRSRSPATGRRSPQLGAPARARARGRARWTASGSPATTGWCGRRSSATSRRCGG